jgi:serine phosphatase RsbU (regulator of sigma subunit)
LINCRTSLKKKTPSSSYLKIGRIYLLYKCKLSSNRPVYAEKGETRSFIHSNILTINYLISSEHIVLNPVRIKPVYYVWLLICIFCCITSPCLSQTAQGLPPADQKVFDQYTQYIDKYQKANNNYELAKYYNLTGNLFWKNKLRNKAIEYFLISIEKNRILGNRNAIKVLNNNVGIIYTELGKDEEALKYFNESLRINRSLGKKTEIAYDQINIGLSLQNLQRFEESSKSMEEALQIATELNDIKTMKTCYGLLAENYEKMGNPSLSMQYYEKFNTIQKHLQQEELLKMSELKNNADASRLMTELELSSTKDTLTQVVEVTKEKQMQIDLLNKEKLLQAYELRDKEALLKNERMVRTILFGVIGFVILITWLIFLQLKQKKKANQLLALKNDEISRQKQKITDSIHYAHRIQKAVLTPRDEVMKVFKEYFIFFRPKEMVSGDFFLLAEKEGTVVVSAVDCTGHGVPGAFMSMLGVSFLNAILNRLRPNELKADTVLNLMRESIINSLHQTGARKENKDGMDMSICIFEPGLKRVHFAGAHNSLYLIRNSVLTHYEADRMPISIHRKADQSFTNHIIDLQPDDRLYLFTDGYADQMGGDKGRKFLSRNLKQLITDISKKPMTEQQQILKVTIDRWQGTNDQRDDLLIVGIKV